VHRESQPGMNSGIVTVGHTRAARGILRTVLAAAVGGTFLLAGCGYTGDAEIETSTAATPPAATAPAAQDDGTRPPARSAYGKAMEAAHRLEDKVEDYNKKIEQAADDAFK
jgi:outer membrane murein-binding lipoprotein Lpp